jgi:hypothetical protein
VRFTGAATSFSNERGCLSWVKREYSDFWQPFFFFAGQSLSIWWVLNPHGSNAHTWKMVWSQLANAWFYVVIQKWLSIQLDPSWYGPLWAAKIWILESLQKIHTYCAKLDVQEYQELSELSNWICSFCSRDPTGAAFHGSLNSLNHDSDGAKLYQVHAEQRKHLLAALAREGPLLWSRDVQRSKIKLI